MEHDRARTNTLPGVLALAGGVLAVIACFLTWGTASPGQSGLFAEESLNATDFDFGWFAIAAGVALLGAGVIWLAGRASMERPLAVVAIVAALAVVLITILNVATKDQQVDDSLRRDFEQAAGRPPTEEEFALVKAELERLGVAVTLEFGIYLTLLGGVMGAAGGLLGLRTTRSGREPPSAYESPPPPALVIPQEPPEPPPPPEP